MLLADFKVSFPKIMYTMKGKFHRLLSWFSCMSLQFRRLQMVSGNYWLLFVSFWLEESGLGISSMDFRRLRKAINVVWFI